jgi:hypothetical protein
VVYEREFYRRFLAFILIGIGLDYQALSHEGIARGHNLGDSLHLHQALPALGDHAQGRVVTEMRDVYTDAGSRLYKIEAVFDLYFDSVYREFRHRKFG